MNKDRTRTIEVDTDVYERFEKKRMQTNTKNLPAMSQSQYLSSLLDTLQAVQEGRYNDE